MTRKIRQCMSNMRLSTAGLFLLLTTPYAESLPPTNNSGAADDQSIQSAFASIDALRKEVGELRTKVTKPPKDVWDMISSTSVLVSGVTVALFGFWATNIYNRRQIKAEERRKNQTIELEEKKFEAQKSIEKLKFGYEQQKWREALVNQLAISHVEKRIELYAPLWSKLELAAHHRMTSGELTPESSKELASYVKDWRYTIGGLLAEPTTREAAYALQQAAWNYDGSKESYAHMRMARRVLRDALRSDMGVSQDIRGRSIVDIVEEQQRKIKSELKNVQDKLGIAPGDR